MIPSADLTTWHSAAAADANLTDAISQHNVPFIRDYYNAVPGSPTLVWNPSVPVSAVKSAIDWTSGANGFQTLTATKQNAYLALTADGANVDATKQNIRDAFGSIFPVAVANALAAVAQTGATRFQALFVTNGVTSYYGWQVSDLDVDQMMGW